MTATYYNNFSFTGTPSNTLCANWPVASMDADGSAAGRGWSTINRRPINGPPGFRFAGRASLSSIKAPILLRRPQPNGCHHVDGGQQLDRPVSRPAAFSGCPTARRLTSTVTGIHTVTVEVRTRDRSPYVRFGWIPPHVQSIIGLKAGDPNGYPTLQSVARKVRFGFGTSSSWAS